MPTTTTITKIFFARSIIDDHTKELQKRRTEGSQYAFRAECPADVDVVRSLLARNQMVCWRQDTCSGWPDTDVTFTITSEGPTLEDIKWLVDRVADCHVICESLAHAADYTGERVALENQYLDGLPRPPQKVISAALEGLNAYLESQEASVNIIREAIEDIRLA